MIHSLSSTTLQKKHDYGKNTYLYLENAFMMLVSAIAEHITLASLKIRSESYPA